MSSKLKSSEEETADWRAFVARNRNIMLLMLAVGTLSYAACEAWAYWGASHAHWENYSLEWNQLEVSPQPGWVRCDVRREVSQQVESPRLALREREVARNVAQSFALHPWVERVVRVTKSFPAKMVVEVDYRRPVAMVEVEYQGQAGLLPVDRFGVLLPPKDFTAGDAKSLPRIRMDKTFPAGSVGSPWGDERVSGACRIAELLVDSWSSSPLFCIIALPLEPGVTSAEARYELSTRGERRLAWGRAPGKEMEGELSAALKVEKLWTALRSPGKDTIDLSAN